MIKLTLKEYIDTKGVTRYKLSKETGIQYHIVDKYYKNTVTRFDSDVLDRICNCLDCNISDLIEYKKTVL
ncbi:MAG: helix-turn-helix transcriptional regulator [Clostridia bacterium]|nr:helix-turn-helix transcriptional regulator [Clostridia bacterium]